MGYRVHTIYPSMNDRFYFITGMIVITHCLSNFFVKFVHIPFIFLI